MSVFVSRKVSHQVCEKGIECHVDLMICDFPENHPGVMRASLARNMSWVNCFKWIKCCEPISINNDYYHPGCCFISIKILLSSYRCSN